MNYNAAGIVCASRICDQFQGMRTIAEFGAVVLMRPKAYARFLDQFDAHAEPGKERTHLHAFDGTAFGDLTNRGSDQNRTTTLASRAPGLTEDFLIPVSVSQIVGTMRSAIDVLEAAGLDRADALDLIIQKPVQESFTLGGPTGLRESLSLWNSLVGPSVVIMIRASEADDQDAAKSVLRSVPRSMRLVTPVVVVTEKAAEMIDEFLSEHGIAPLTLGCAVVLAGQKLKIHERHRARTSGGERTLTAAIASALAWAGNEVEEAHSWIANVLEEDDPDDAETLRAELKESGARERALAVQLANVRAELKHANGHRWALERQLGNLHDDVGVTLDAAEPPTTEAEAPPPPWHLPLLPENSFATMLPRARQRFTNLVLDDSIDKLIQPLDSHPKRDIWLLRAWTSLALLDDYVTAKHTGDTTGTFRAWIEVHPHPLIRPSHVRSGETASMQSGKYREARTFVVPTVVDSSGRAMFLTHIYIEPGKVRPNPRLHYLDDTTGGTGKIYVGHLGPHLTTRRTN